ncbi:MAG: Tim44 domain-containing protein [Alphaproteobacteria bacterium]|nr:Tim44 domain-containing protein [Alphaproteobacteria bacterium]
MFAFFFFFCVTVFLLIRLNDILGTHIGFKTDFNDKRLFSDDESTIEEVRKDDTSSVHADLGFIPNGFLEKSKKAFEIVFEAYANGDKDTLKGLLAPKLYSAFCLAIDDRQSRGEKLEGILVRFLSAEIVESSINNEDAFITVKFVTEQSNVLKSRDGIVLEGDSDFVEKRTDTWVFCHKKSSNSPVWLLYEIIDG